MLLNEHIDEMNHELMVPRFIYIIECQEMFKVGMATCAKARLDTLQKICPYPMKLRHYRKVERAIARRVEKSIHESLKEYRTHGEWFVADYATVKAAFLRGVTVTNRTELTKIRQRSRRWLTKAAKRQGVEL